MSGGQLIINTIPRPGPPVWEIAVHLAVPGDVYDGVFLSQDVLNEIWDLVESVSEGFPIYS